MNRQTTILRRTLRGTALLSGALLLARAASAQVLLEEHFTGGASTTGFTITQDGGNCQWTYAPGGLLPNNFQMDGDGQLPIGAGFDSDFAFIDSDECNGGNSNTSVNTYLISPAFDASAAGSYVLSFSHQFLARLASYCRVEVFNGDNWVEVHTWTGDNVGYPNPAVMSTFDITAATNGAANAQVRFQFHAGWDWWWAIDNVLVQRTQCGFPAGLAVGGLTIDGGTISWTDNGSPAYDWAVTTGGIPDGSNELATGDGSNTTATGLLSGTNYTVFVRAQCAGGGTSAWSSGVPFVTLITNDEPSGAIHLAVNPDLSCSSTAHGTVSGATGSGFSTSCYGEPDDDVWFSFVATGTEHYISIINSFGFATDLYHAVWSGDPAAPTLLENSCSDGDFSLASGLTIGETYYVQVYTYTSDPGQNTQFDVCIGTPPPPPANDECSGAVALTVNPDLECGTVTPGTVTSATDSGVQTDCGGTANDDVWFSFTATNATHRISLINIDGTTTTDLYLALWSGACGNLELVPGSCSDYEVKYVNDLTVGETYYLQVYTYTSESGQIADFDVCIGTPPPPPANDECDGAYPVAVNPDLDCAAMTHGTVTSATPSGLPTDCYGSPDDDVWFSFVASNPTHYVSLRNSEGSTTDLYHAVWSGACGNMTLIEGSCSDGDFSSVSGLTIGETYYVQVYTYTDEGGQDTEFDVCISTPGPPPLNDECAGAEALVPNTGSECVTTTQGTVLNATGSGLATDCYGSPDDDVWYSFTATNTAHIFQILNSAGSNTDLYHALWSGDCNNLTLVTNSCNDGDASMFSGLTIGETYYVQVYTYTNEPGQNTTYELCLTIPGPPPVNDECAGAVGLTVNLNEQCANVTPGTVENATGSGLPLHTDCYGTPDDDVWFSFTALAPEHTISLLNVNGSTSDMYMALWTGDCNDLTFVEGSCSDPEDMTISGLTVGTTYYLQVYTYTSTPLQTSTFDVCVGTDPTLFPPDCEGVPGGPAVPGT
ncbi:MAG: fibronectin type III domain-containing protein, partial [Bacteroidetes bacterium]|nr:fibronectin type III domain-containing protein [Bacteroidota bacterium]